LCVVYCVLCIVCCVLCVVCCVCCVVCCVLVLVEYSPKTSHQIGHKYGILVTVCQARYLDASPEAISLQSNNNNNNNTTNNINANALNALQPSTPSTSQNQGQNSGTVIPLAPPVIDTFISGLVAGEEKNTTPVPFAANPVWCVCGCVCVCVYVWLTS
jgi:hypothetical protein